MYLHESPKMFHSYFLTLQKQRLYILVATCLPVLNPITDPILVIFRSVGYVQN